MAGWTCSLGTVEGKEIGKGLFIDDLASLALEFIRKDKLIAFIETLPTSILRLKGWVRFPDESAFLDFIWGRYRLEPVPKPRDTALTFVGRNCSETEIISALKDCMENR